MLLLSLNVAVLLCVLPSAVPEDVCQKWVDGIMYRQEILMSNLIHPSRFTLDRSTNTLYFNYYNKEIEAFKSAKFNIDTKSYGVIEELVGTCWQTFDPVTSKRFAGCRNDAGRGGLYEYDTNVCKFVPIAEEGKDIWFAYFNDVLYYSIYPVGTVHTYEDGRVQCVSDMDATGVKQLVVSKDKTRHFYNDTSYYYKKPGDVIVEYGNNTLKPLSVDATGKARYNNNSNNDFAYDMDNNMVYAELTSDVYKIIRLLRC